MIGILVVDMATKADTSLSDITRLLSTIASNSREHPKHKLNTRRTKTNQPFHSKTLKNTKTGNSAIKTVLRSKGFMWLANSHTTAYYWSHAGQHFEIRDEGEWWGAVPDSDWPNNKAQRDVVLADFDLTTNYGDRRQEIVFIGARMDEAAICDQLDGALLSDEEMVQYVKQYEKDADPKHVFVEEKRKEMGVEF